MNWSDDAPSLDAGARRYLELMRSTLTREAFLDQEWRDVDLDQWPDGRGDIHPILRRQGWRLVEQVDAAAVRLEGRDWPPTAETMVGSKRLENVLRCCCRVLEADVPGDFVETGVWRGGVTILMRGVLAAYDDGRRTVWAADSFEGLPAPDADRYPADTIDWSHVEPLKVDLEAVRRNFARYDLLDDQVAFLPGWFEDTLPTAPIEEIAVLRLDGDLYQSTMDALGALYGRVSEGGFVIVDDYGGWRQCREAVDDYRARHDITDPMIEVDWTGVFWQKTTGSM